MEEIKPDLPQSKYHPLTLAEFQELRDFIKGMGAYLPENKAPWIWDTYLKLTNTHENRPCMCTSSAGHWRRAVDFLFDWVKNKE